METIKRLYKMDGNLIHYLRWIVEAYDGAAVVTTIDAREGLVALRIAPGYEDVIYELIESLKSREGISIEQKIETGIRK